MNLHKTWCQKGNDIPYFQMLHISFFAITNVLLTELRPYMYMYCIKMLIYSTRLASFHIPLFAK